jgi:transcriptional regulator with XRE-family HTH domain
MSDEELAAAAGMHRVTLSRKKSGERATTTADMDAIAAVLAEVRVDVTIDLPFVTDNRQYLTSADPSDQGKGYAA